MRFFKWIKVFLQGGRCFKCKYYSKPFCYYNAGYSRWSLDEDCCADFEEMERKDK